MCWATSRTADATGPYGTSRRPWTPAHPAAARPRRSLRWTTERWVTDRRTNAPVHCCGERPVFDGDAYLKFPFDLKQRSYRWWDSTLGAAVPLRFSGTTRVEGHRGYRFTGTVRPTRIGTRLVRGRWWTGRARARCRRRSGTPTPASSWSPTGAPAASSTPASRPGDAARTGGHRDAVTLLRSGGIRFTDATRRAQVGLARDDNDRLRLVGRVAPLAAASAGTVLTAAGAALTLRRPRRT
ncbi:porin PorA family protein [Streptomyces sp. M19]